MSASRFRTAAAFAALLCWGGAAGALTIDYQPLPDQSAPAIVQNVSGVTVTAQGFGGVANPQASMTPTGTPGGFTALAVNVGGSSFFGTRGLGCGPVASQCDLIAPIGEDALRITFSLPVQIDSITIAAMEDPDDVTWWYWNGASYVLAGQDGCTTFSFCGGNETFAGPFGAPSTSWLLVAESSGASAFALRSLDFTVYPVPEPGSALLVALGLAAAAARRRPHACAARPPRRGGGRARLTSCAAPRSPRRRDGWRRAAS
jgi:hypothetical protein